MPPKLQSRGHKCFRSKSPSASTANLLGVRSMKIVAKDYHPNGGGLPFICAIVDNPEDGDTKLVIMFDEPDCVAVLSLDYLLRDEDISNKYNGHHGDRYEQLRKDLWDGFES